MAVVVKRRGKTEIFDEKKIYASVYAACMECDLGSAKSQSVADEIVAEVKNFLKGKAEVNSTEIFGFVIQKLAKNHEPVAFMYQTHREVPKL